MKFNAGDMVVHVDRKGEPVPGPKTYEVRCGLDGSCCGFGPGYYTIRSAQGIVKPSVSGDRLREAAPEEIVDSGWPGCVTSRPGCTTLSDALGEFACWRRSVLDERPDVVVHMVEAIKLNYESGSAAARHYLQVVETSGEKDQLLGILSDIDPYLWCAQRECLLDLLRQRIRGQKHCPGAPESDLVVFAKRASEHIGSIVDFLNLVSGYIEEHMGRRGFLMRITDDPRVEEE